MDWDKYRRCCIDVLNSQDRFDVISILLENDHTWHGGYKKDANYVFRYSNTVGGRYILIGGNLNFGHVDSFIGIPLFTSQQFINDYYGLD